MTTTGTGQGLGAEQGAQGEPDISCECFSRIVPAAVPDAPHLVAYGGHVTKLHQRRAPRARRILASLDPLLDVDGQMAADFFVEVTFVGSHRSLLHVAESVVAGFMRRPMA